MIALTSVNGVESLAQYEINMSLVTTGYGDPLAAAPGFPNSYERQTLMYYNWVRQDPYGFKTRFIVPYGDNTTSNVFTNTTMYPGGVKPIQYNPNLNRANRAHIVDQLGTCPKSTASPHNDCNGTSFGGRLARWYSSGNVGEIWQGVVQSPPWPIFQHPWVSIMSYICDGYFSIPFGKPGLGNCATDANAGHRSNIMKINGEVGCGTLIVNGQLGSSCDEGGSLVTAPSWTNLIIYEGVHAFLEQNQTQIYFFINFAAASAPTDASLFTAPAGSTSFTSQQMTLATNAGNASNGVYQSTAFPVTANSNCTQYYFSFTANGITQRYPATTIFTTAGVGACPNDTTTSITSSASLVTVNVFMSSITVAFASLLTFITCM